jgi:hypothetical protein
MKSLSLMALTFVLSLPVFANAPCAMHFKTEDLCLTVNWEAGPARNVRGSAILTFTDSKDTDRMVVPKHAPFIMLWMPSMNHGSTPVTMTDLGGGRYRASNVSFIMGGPWDIRYQLKNGPKVVEELIQKVSI